MNRRQLLLGATASVAASITPMDDFTQPARYICTEHWITDDTAWRIEIDHVSVADYLRQLDLVRERLIREMTDAEALSSYPTFRRSRLPPV